MTKQLVCVLLKLRVQLDSNYYSGLLYIKEGQRERERENANKWHEIDFPLNCLVWNYSEYYVRYSPLATFYAVSMCVGEAHQHSITLMLHMQYEI